MIIFKVYFIDCISMRKRISGGAMRDRTADLLRARQALSQLSYSPTYSYYVLDRKLLVQDELKRRLAC